MPAGKGGEIFVGDLRMASNRVTANFRFPKRKIIRPKLMTFICQDRIQRNEGICGTVSKSQGRIGGEPQKTALGDWTRCE